MTNLHKIKALIGVVSFVFLAQNPAFAAGVEIGVNSAVKGDVTIKSGEQAAKQAVIKSPVFLGDVVKSNRVGSLQVLLKDQTLFTVGPDCDLTIDKFVYDPTKNTNAMSATVKKGMFRFMSGNISKSGPNSVSIDTPVASMGIRGTMVEGLLGRDAIQAAINAGIISPNTPVNQAHATLFVLKGPGKNSRANNSIGEISVTSGGKTIIVKDVGQAVFIADQNTPPSAPFTISAADTKKFHNRLRTEPTGKKSYKPFDTPRASNNAQNSPPNGGNEFGQDTAPDNDTLDPSTDLQRPLDDEGLEEAIQEEQEMLDMMDDDDMMDDGLDANGNPIDDGSMMDDGMMDDGSSDMMLDDGSSDMMLDDGSSDMMLDDGMFFDDSMLGDGLDDGFSDDIGSGDGFGSDGFGNDGCNPNIDPSC